MFIAWRGYKLPRSPLLVHYAVGETFCGTCPRSRFLGSFTNHFDGLPTIRPCGLSPVSPTNRELSTSRYHGTSNTGVREEVLMLENIRHDEKQC